MKTAAVAITHGLDPLDLLALGEGDYDIAVAALNEAESMRAQRDTALIKVTAEGVSARIVYRLVRAFRVKR